MRRPLKLIQFFCWPKGREVKSEVKSKIKKDFTVEAKFGM